MKLYDFQLDGARFLAKKKRAYLADEMGLGKTVQASYATRLVKPKNVLVISPASAIENWKREYAEWGYDAALDVRSYADPKLHEVRGADFDVMIVDEAHYCKTHTAKRTKRVLDIARRAGRAWLLSATPMPNHPGELYAPIRVLWPYVCKELGLLTHWQWYRHFCRWTQAKRGPYAYGIKNADDLRPYLREFMLRRTLDQVGLQLPSLRVDVFRLPRDENFARALREQYDELAAAMIQNEMADIEADEEGSTSKLRRLLGEYKAPHIAEIIAEELKTQQYNKIVVLYYHKAVGDVLRRRLRLFGVTGFDGSTSHRLRQLAVDTFTTAPDVRVFVAQQTAAGVAINLQIANELVLVEPSWSPGENAQAIYRIRRIGSTRPCRARIFAVAGSLDEAIMSVEANKIRMQASLGLSGKAS